MANEILQKVGSPQISFADHAGDFVPTESLEIGTPTDVDFTMTGLVDGAYLNSDKFDFGAKRAAQYTCMCVIEWGSAPAAGKTVQFWHAPTENSTAATGNPGGADGVDGAYVGYGAAAVDADEAVAQLQYIGALVTTADTGIQIAFVGTFSPPARFSQLVMKNASGVTLFTDDVEMHVVFTPVTDEVQ